MGVPAGATQNQIMNQQITMKTHTQGGGLSDDPVQHPFYTDGKRKLALRVERIERIIYVSGAENST